MALQLNSAMHGWINLSSFVHSQLNSDTHVAAQDWGHPISVMSPPFFQVQLPGKATPSVCGASGNCNTPCWIPPHRTCPQQSRVAKEHPEGFFTVNLQSIEGLFSLAIKHWLLV